MPCKVRAECHTIPAHFCSFTQAKNILKKKKDGMAKREKVIRKHMRAMSSLSVLFASSLQILTDGFRYPEGLSTSSVNPPESITAPEREWCPESKNTSL